MKIYVNAYLLSCECSFNLVYRHRSVLPIHLQLHPGHVNSYTTKLWYLIGVFSLFDRNELLLVVFQRITNVHFIFSKGVILFINEWVINYCLAIICLPKRVGNLDTEPLQKSCQRSYIVTSITFATQISHGQLS